ncbi:MAG: serine hydrolase domain-containing protein [Casimicrobiaceae bacterium]
MSSIAAMPDTVDFRRRRLVLGAPLLLSACWIDDSSNNPSPTRLRATVQSVLDRYNAPGAVAGVWRRDVPPWKAALGVANVATGRSMTLDDFFSIRSITKSYVVTALLLLARDGALSLDDPIATYVPGIPNGDRITLTQLAAMESGVKSYTGILAFVEEFLDHPERVWTDAEIVGYAIPASPVFDPGAQYDYSNTNTILIGMVIEKVAKAPLADVLRTRIFEPLGLRSTSYPSAIDLPSPHPLPYAANRSAGPPTLFPFWDPSGFGAAGAMVSTLDDLGVWGEALGTGRLLTPALQSLRVSHSRPATDGPVYDHYGLGIGEIHGYWGHTGEALGFQSAVMHHPERGITIAVLVNATPAISEGRSDNIAEDIFEELADAVGQ